MYDGEYLYCLSKQFDISSFIVAVSSWSWGDDMFERILYRVNTDGSEVLHISDNVTEFCTTDTGIFFGDGCHVYFVSKNDYKNKQELIKSSNIRNIYVQEGKLYFKSAENYCMDLQNGEIKKE